MNYLTPLTEDEKRRRARLSGIVEDGEYLSFNPILCDSRSGAPTSAVFLTDAIRAEVDRAEAAHDHKFSFMGDAAPKFDRERAEIIARQKVGGTNNSKALADFRYRDAIVPGEYASQSAEKPNADYAASTRAMRDAARDHFISNLG